MKRTLVMKPTLLLLAALLLAPAAFAVDGTPARLTDLTDLTADGVVSVPLTERVAAAPRDAVHFSWPLAADAQGEIDLAPRAAVARSKEYRLDVSAEELRAGVPLPLVSAGATVRLNPVSPSVAGASTKALAARVLAPESLVLVDPAGTRHSDGAAMEAIAGMEALKAAGAPFAEGTTAFRLRADLGAGAWQLRAPGLVGDDRYTLFVLESGSDIELTTRTGRAAYLAGQPLTLHASLVRGETHLPVDTLRGLVVSPDGRTFEVEWRAGRNGYQGRLPLAVAGSVETEGLWEAHLAIHAAVDGAPVLRNVKTAFAVALPTARLGHLAARQPVDSGDGLAVTLPLEVGSAGRYQLHGVLFGTAEDGTLQPLGVGQSAAWLEPGEGQLRLRFDAATLAARPDLGAPYVVRDLRLLDQGRMGLLETRGLGFELAQ
jgi:hypothetical protein